MRLDPSHPKFDISADETVTLVRTGGTVLYGFHAANVNAADLFLQLFDVAAVANVTLGTTVPNQSFLIQKGAASARVASSQLFDNGILFDQGLVYAVTTAPGGSTGPDTDIELNLQYNAWGT